MKDKKNFDWRSVPDEVAARTRELWSASLGLAQAVEQKGEEWYGALTGDRAALVERWQAEGTKVVDDLQLQANRVFDDLVKRGETLQEHGRRAVENASRRVAAGPKAVAEEVTHTAEQAVRSVLARMDVPTRSELGRLSDRVERLTREVHRLAVRLAGEPEGPGVLEVASMDGAWVVRDVRTGEVRFKASTKAEAVREGRERARAESPSELHILKLDGSIQDVSHYGEHDEETGGAA